ncbi:hypothetical protein lerEdw1_014157 [Lerista edwardsae]|nr:hypothetical protein lerEdw1_014157 [Lerista edwardsae]
MEKWAINPLNQPVAEAALLLCSEYVTKLQFDALEIQPWGRRKGMDESTCEVVPFFHFHDGQNSEWYLCFLKALIKREVKATFSRMLKVQGPALSSTGEDTQRKKSCPLGCLHQTVFPSQIIHEIKDVLCIAVGPRDDHEEIQFVHLESLLGRLSETLNAER